MSKVVDAGITTAYGAAVRGGYDGTYEQFCADLARLADVLSEFLGFSVTIQTLAAGQQATASYENGVLSLGIPRGDTGNGIQSISLLSTVGLVKTYRITYTNGNNFDFPVADGKGIQSTTLNNDYTLTIEYTDGTSWTSASIRGAVGATPHLTIGTVQTLSPGQSATASITGTDTDPVLNLGIPEGQAGASDAGAVSYNPESSYNDGTVGKELSTLNRQLNDLDTDKQDAPATAGIAGQVLSLDDQLNPVWSTPSGGNVDIELEPYSSSKTYAVGDYCEYSGGMYQCNTPITTAEAWNSAHWTAITASDLIGDMNDRLDMVVIMQEVDQPTPPASSSQLVNPEDITWVYQSSKWRGKIAKIPLDNNGTYYPNPAKIVNGDTSEFTCLYNTAFFDAYDQQLTLTKTDQTTKNTLDLFTASYGSYIVIENKRTIKLYARNTLASTWTTTADIAYMGGSNCFIAYPSSDSAQVGVTYEEQSNSYIPYGGGPAPEPKYEWNYTVAMAQFVEEYMQAQGTAASNNMFNFVYPEKDNSEFANTLKYYQERFDRQKDDIIRIGSFNKFISRGRGNWSTIKQELADYTLDICGFQESPAIVENDEITAQIGSALQGQQFVSYAPQNKTIGQALVSHWEVATTECLEIYQTDNVTSTCMHGIINLYPYKWYSNFVSNVCTLSVYVYHGRSQNDTIGGVSTSSLNIRKAEIDAILALVAQDTSDFIVIVGDTNCFESGLDTTTATHQEWEKFRSAGYTPVLEGYESTVTADLASTHFFAAGDGKAYCDACYDQIFIGSNIEAVGYSVVDSNLYPVESLGGVPVSDHCMVYADLKFDFDAAMNAKMVAALS